MSEISAGLVKELRELTGLGFMECKKALAEAGGDLKKAEELLRIKSGAKATKAASRIAAEGVIGAWLSADGKLGALVELNCETDFVAKNEEFIAFSKSLAEIVATRNPKEAQELGSLDLLGTKVEAKRQALVQKIGENMTIRRFKRLQARGKLALYLHGTKIGVLVDVGVSVGVAVSVGVCVGVCVGVRVGVSVGVNVGVDVGVFVGVGVRVGVAVSVGVVVGVSVGVRVAVRVGVLVCVGVKVMH